MCKTELTNAQWLFTMNPAMSDKRIIFISKKNFPIEKIQKYFAKEHNKDYDIQVAADFAQSEDYLLDPEYTLCLLVADFRDTSLFAQVEMLKSDEIFCFLPVLGLLPEVNAETLNALIQCGCENYLEEQHLKSFLINYMQIILSRSEHMKNMSLQVSQLQEKGIRDFILLDLIKNYIPRTIWSKAEDFAQKQRLELNSEEMELVVCFGDLCKFSTLSQYKQPKEVVDLLNLVFEVATRYVFYFQGDIDKFIGDAFLAIFRDIRQAIKACYGIQKELQEVNRKQREIGHDVVQFRIGMHVGNIIRGNVGGNNRFDNTLIGDTVNTASRLEGKAPDGNFVISEAICKLLGLDIGEEYRMSSELKGREGQEIYYSMLDYLDANPDAILGLQEEINEARNTKGRQALQKNFT